MSTQRTVVIAVSVVIFHAAALWALQSGLLRRVVEIVVPVQVLSELLTPPEPKVPPPPPPPKPLPRPAQQEPRVVPQPLPAAPLPLPIADPSPAPNAPTVVARAPAPLPPIAAAVAPAAPPAPAPRVELPSSDADYLQNPAPAYPALSKRLGEQGKVVVRVLIGADGVPQKAEVRSSSGFERLDQAALATVLKWRYLPGKRGGVAEAMWFNVPIAFVLD